MSADGARVAFVRYTVGQSPEVWIAHRDGSGARNLSNHAEIVQHPALSPDGGCAAFPAWSPDSQRIAYMSNATGRYVLWPMRADGGDQRVVTTSEHDQFELAWSPDGQRIAFVSSHDGNGREVYVMSPEGTGVQRWANNQLLEGRPAWLERP